MINRFRALFGTRKVFLPVIHLPDSGTIGFQAIKVAVDAGADGVFLINQGATVPEVYRLAREVREIYPDLWMGVNELGSTPSYVARSFGPFTPFRGHWADDCGVDGWFRHDLDREFRGGDLYQEGRDTSGWEGIYFGGTAFKTQREITDVPELMATAALAATFVDVVTTSGVDTGTAPMVSKIALMKAAIGDTPLAIASGITPANVTSFLPYADAFLVASGIEDSFGVLNPAKTRDLATTIHTATVDPIALEALAHATETYRKATSPQR